MNSTHGRTLGKTKENAHHTTKREVPEVKIKIPKIDVKKKGNGSGKPNNGLKRRAGRAEKFLK